jgi:hypothetical protein
MEPIHWTIYVYNQGTPMNSDPEPISLCPGGRAAGSLWTDSALDVTCVDCRRIIHGLGVLEL